MENVEIITLEPQDWKQYRDLRLRALQEEPHAYGSTYADNVKNSDESWMERLKDASLEKAQWLVFAKHNDTVVGMAGAFAQKEIDTAQVIAVYVVPEERGKGISKLLMSDILTRIKKNKFVRKILVDVNPEQEAAYNLYKNYGFEVTKKYNMILGDGKEHDVIQLQMRIE